VKRFLRVMAWVIGLPVALILMDWANWVVRVGPPEQREPYYVNQSPDGRYKIVLVPDASYWKVFSFAMPGQGGAGDSPGIVMLVDAQGRELARASVDMMQTVPGAIRWSSDSVGIVPVGIWRLSKPDTDK
jgi:hypothetical protein